MTHLLVVLDLTRKFFYLPSNFISSGEEIPLPRFIYVMRGNKGCLRRSSKLQVAAPLSFSFAGILYPCGVMPVVQSFRMFLLSPDDPPTTERGQAV